MRIVEKVLYGFGGLLALILLFVALCHYNPGMTEKIGALLDKDSIQVEAKGRAGDLPAGKSEEAFVAAAVSRTYTIGELPAAEGPSVIAGSADAAARAADDDTDKESEGQKLNIPGKVAGLTGYIPVVATGTEITQEKADEIAATLDKGETGDGLEFEERMYPYYHMLNDRQRAVYRQIYANAGKQNKRFAPAQADLTVTDLKNAFTSVVNDHPELFWVDTAYKYKYTPKGQIADITLVYNITANNLDTAKSEFEAAAKLITDETYGHYTDYEKERIAHDELIDRVKYDANAPLSQSAYGALVYGRSVCAGYSRAFQYILQQLNIPCYYVTGYAGQNHAWNIVKLEDGYYNVDSTWADTTPNTYDYFNCSDEDYASNHVRKDLSIYLPPCRGNKYSGLEVNPSEKPPVDTTVTPPPTSTGSTAAETTKPSSTTGTTTSTTTSDPSRTTSSSTTTGTTPGTQDDSIMSLTVTTVRGTQEAYYIETLEDYYNECFGAMISKNSRNINFNLIVVDEDLWDEIYDSYNDGGCQEGYIDRYLVEKHRTECSIDIDVVPRSDGSYLLRHRASVS